MKSFFLVLFFGFSAILLRGQDLIERNYFDNAKAKNAAIAAARYAEESYYYTKFTTFLSSVDSSRIFADTALFFMKRSLMLTDTSLFHAPKTNLRALNLLYEGKGKLLMADSVMREFYPMVEISSHNSKTSSSFLALFIVLLSRLTTTKARPQTALSTLSRGCHYVNRGYFLQGQNSIE